jgi:hypothetical protein
MNGAIPLLPLYIFIMWTGTTLPLLPCTETSSGAHPTSYATGTAGPYPAGSGLGMTQTTHLLLAER